MCGDSLCDAYLKLLIFVQGEIRAAIRAPNTGLHLTTITTTTTATTVVECASSNEGIVMGAIEEDSRKASGEVGTWRRDARLEAQADTQE